MQGALTQRQDKFWIDAQGCVEIPQGRVDIGLYRVEKPAVEVRLRVFRSQFNGLSVIV